MKDKITSENGSEVEPEYICNKCNKNDFDILLRPPDRHLLGLIFNRIKHSKHIWPIKRYVGPIQMTKELGTNLSIIEQNVKNESYRSFKTFMDEMIQIITSFRDYYSPDRSDYQQIESNNKREIKCCEILEYDFSNYIRQYIYKNRTKVNVRDNARNQLLQRLPGIQQNEMRIQAGLASSSN